MAFSSLYRVSLESQAELKKGPEEAGHPSDTSQDTVSSARSTRRATRAAPFSVTLPITTPRSF